MGESGVVETCVELVQNMYEGCEAVVGCDVGAAEGFGVGGWTAPGISVEPISVCSDGAQTGGWGGERAAVDHAVC